LSQDAAEGRPVSCAHPILPPFFELADDLLKAGLEFAALRGGADDARPAVVRVDLDLTIGMDRQVILTE
jgi:hypothetical protein